ncbi:hypothetical protein KEF85_09135 [Methylomonas paludis]|uniref:Uncharacterized protein n=1 Tax=Methylomonas paludis TaxID=1173101 RepID=A0A975R8U8_9GAMM|nr:hypothetical protein [Methylomonas paludis]QWF69544.1 hypothetical protein KEF85_09135 [Methylomonas paludis]
MLVLFTKWHGLYRAGLSWSAKLARILYYSKQAVVLALLTNIALMKAPEDVPTLEAHQSWLMRILHSAHPALYLSKQD